jgi:hypothetical protein
LKEASLKNMISQNFENFTDEIKKELDYESED